jgi:rubrerythrin
MKTILISVCLASVFGTMQAPEKTLSNLERAIELEANASRRYEMYAKKAADEGYLQEVKLFKAIAKSDSIQMENHKYALIQLGGEPKEIDYKDVTVKSTRENIKEPIKSERKAVDKMYPEFIKDAVKDKAEIAEKSFKSAMNAEEQNQKLFQKASDNLGNNPSADYYVSNKTGVVIEESPDAGKPMTKNPGEKYIKF